MTDISSPKRSSITTWLWNPFTLIAGGPALTAGLIFLLATGLLAAPTRTHFDGVLDTHIGFPAPVWYFLSENLINWLSLSLVLWVTALFLKGPGKFRAIDLFGTQALARWPFLLTALASYLPGMQKVTHELNQMVIKGKINELPKVSAVEMGSFFFVTFVMILVTIWFVALAWKSFRISCDVRGGKAIAAFVVGILVAEVISKIVILKGLTALLPQS